MAFVFGAVLGMALFGALFAWILRWVFPLPLYWSYALGIALMAPIAALSYSSNENGISYAGAFAIYGLSGVLAFPVLVSSSLIGVRPEAGRPIRRGKIAIILVKSVCGLLAALAFAGGLTSVFVATRSTYDAAAPFFFGVILLMFSAGMVWILRKDWRRSEPLGDDAR